MPVRRLVEVAGRAELNGNRRRVMGQEHGPEERFFGFEVVRGDPGPGRRGSRGGAQGTRAGVFKGLDHGLPTLPVMTCGQREPKAGDSHPETRAAAVDNSRSSVEKSAGVSSPDHRDRAL